MPTGTTQGTPGPCVDGLQSTIWGCRGRYECAWSSICDHRSAVMPWFAGRFLKNDLRLVYGDRHYWATGFDATYKPSTSQTRTHGKSQAVRTSKPAAERMRVQDLHLGALRWRDDGGRVSTAVEAHQSDSSGNDEPYIHSEASKTDFRRKEDIRLGSLWSTDLQPDVQDEGSAASCNVAGETDSEQQDARVADRCASLRQSKLEMRARETEAERTKYAAILSWVFDAASNDPDTGVSLEHSQTTVQRYRADPAGVLSQHTSAV